LHISGLPLAHLVTMLEAPQTAPESLPSRKRSKAPEENDEDRGKKRSRGRPRLDTRDETAQDVSSTAPQFSHSLKSDLLILYSAVEPRFGWLNERIVIAKILQLPLLRTKSKILRMLMTV
jgi:hypothetical protein